MIYLASPYSHPDAAVMEQRFHDVCRVAGSMMHDGLIVFSPIAHTHSIAVVGKLPRSWEFWGKYDHEFIAASEKVIVLMMDGWLQSKGVRAEILIANSLNIPVEYMEFDLQSVI